MGCDAYATEEGRFSIAVFSWDTGRFLGRLEIEDLELEERIQVDYEEGRER